MASIFKATDEVSDQPVVLKIPYAQFEKDAIFYSRFQREETLTFADVDLDRLRQGIAVEDAGDGRERMVGRIALGQDLSLQM